MRMVVSVIVIAILAITGCARMHFQMPFRVDPLSAVAKATPETKPVEQSAPPAAKAPEQAKKEEKAKAPTPPPPKPEKKRLQVYQTSYTCTDVPEGMKPLKVHRKEMYFQDGSLLVESTVKEVGFWASDWLRIEEFFPPGYDAKKKPTVPSDKASVVALCNGSVKNTADPVKPTRTIYTWVGGGWKDFVSPAATIAASFVIRDGLAHSGSRVNASGGNSTATGGTANSTSSAYNVSP